MNEGIPPAIRPALTAYAANLRAVFGSRLRDVRLFGPWARPGADPNADVDILVLVDQLADTETVLAERQVAAIVLEHRLALTPLVMSSQQFESMLQQDASLALEIESEGISV